MDRDIRQSRTPSQTVGPYFGIGLSWVDGPLVVAAATAGAFWIRGRVTDGANEPVPDALIETWQADPEGGFVDDAGAVPAGFRGFGRCPTDRDGQFAILTVRPGRVTDPDGVLQAPHVDVAVFARGLLKQLITRIYFPESPSNDSDPVLTSIPDHRRHTLVATKADDGYRFDIHLQGDDETAFFEP